MEFLIREQLRLPRRIAGYGVVAALLLVVSCDRAQEAAIEIDTASVYVHSSPGSEDGTGRHYMGREIAKIAGVGREQWLDRPERETEELPNRVVRSLELDADAVVADIGAGTGYFTFRILPHVPEGRVFAVDIEKDMLDMIRKRASRRGFDNVVPVLGTVRDPNLPSDSIDVALIVFAYTQFSHPQEMMVNLRDALKPGGRVVLVEYRGEDPTIPVSPVYKITDAQARAEMAAAGLDWRETRDILPQHHFMVFEKPIR
jgi:SAM-dependent methyltransferase